MKTKEKTYPVPVHAGELIRHLRLMKGLQQQELADLIGIKQPNISVLERNESCELRTLQKIADATETILWVEFIPKSLRGA